MTMTMTMKKRTKLDWTVIGNDYCKYKIPNVFLLVGMHCVSCRIAKDLCIQLARYCTSVDALQNWHEKVLVRELATMTLRFA